MRSILDQYRKTTGKITADQALNQDKNVETLQKELRKADYTPEQLINFALKVMGNNATIDNSMKYKTRTVVAWLTVLKRQNKKYRAANNMNLGDNKK